MNEWSMKKIPLGSFLAEDVALSQVWRREGEKAYLNRPVVYWSVPSRLKMALDVFLGKADALYWHE